MKTSLANLLVAGIAITLCSCASSSLKSTWKSPEFAKPPAKIAIIAVDERPTVRQIMEGQFATQLEKRGQAALRVHEHLGLEAIKADRKAAGDRLRELGADAVLIVRLVNSATYAREVQTTGGFVPVTTGFASAGWYAAYDLAFMDMGTTYSSVSTMVLLDNSLFELESGKRLWTGVTKTVVKENTDRLAEVRPLVGKVVNGMVKDGVVH